jgi:hypothetical protein
MVVVCNCGWTERARRSSLTSAARRPALRREKSRFMKEEWPALRTRLKRLGIELRTLAETFDD